MSIYEAELQNLRTDDEIQTIVRLKDEDLDYIPTAGHGYLVVPKEHPQYKEAVKISGDYSYNGKNAVYLEQDCEAGKFLNLLKTI